jgi:L-ascorbate metabolism protein UlaG (beta-lactamase superfamily)
MPKSLFLPAAAVLLAALTFGCKPPESPAPTQTPPPPASPAAQGLKAGDVSVTWFGQSCFLLEDVSGLTLLIDPFDPSRLGYPDPGLRNRDVDIMSISHEHYDHNYTALVKAATYTVRGPGSHQAGSVLFTGIGSSHGPNGGGVANTISTWEMDSIKFCHLGDLGVLLTSEQISRIGPVDVLFIPVGGHFTIDASQATQVMESLHPKIVIPMHFRTPALTPSIHDVLAPPDDFVAGKDKHPDFGKHTVTLNKDALPQTTQVLEMAYE